MTKVKFLFSDEILVGFHISGHSTANANDEQGRLVCASISSAAYMTANTVTEIIGAKANAKVDDKKGEMLFKISSDYEEAMPVLMGFKLHIEQLSLQFTDYIKVTSEV